MTPRGTGSRSTSTPSHPRKTRAGRWSVVTTRRATIPTKNRIIQGTRRSIGWTIRQSKQSESNGLLRIPKKPPFWIPITTRARKHLSDSSETPKRKSPRLSTVPDLLVALERDRLVSLSDSAALVEVRSALVPDLRSARSGLQLPSIRPTYNSIDKPLASSATIHLRPRKLPHGKSTRDRKPGLPADAPRQT